MTVAVACIGLLGLLVFGLGFAVSASRGQAKVLIGSPTDPTDNLHKLIRAHGNTAEYAGMLAVLIWVAAMREPASWVLGAMIAATLGRYVIVAGLLMGRTLDSVHPVRFVGAFLTYVGGTALSLAVLLSL